LSSVPRDRFVAIESSAYEFPAHRTEAPFFTTQPLTPPVCEFAVVLNVQSSVIGMVFVELLRDGSPVHGFSLEDADGAVGNFLDKRVSWDHGKRASLTADYDIQLRVYVIDASVFAFSLVCTEGSATRSKTDDGQGNVTTVSPPTWRPPPLPPGCQAKLDAFCSSATENGPSCIQPQRKQFGHSMAPYFARYDRSTPKSPAKHWRCYSHEALSADHSHWDPAAKNPSAFCSESGAILARIAACSAPPPSPPIGPPPAACKEPAVAASRASGGALVTPTGSHQPAIRLHVVAMAGGTPAAGSMADGSAARPFVTVTAARDWLRGLQPLPAGGAVVQLFCGVHSPFQLTSADSGTATAPISYTGMTDTHGQPCSIVSAGMHVPPSAFSPWKQRPGVLVANLSALGMTSFGAIANGDLEECQNHKAELFYAGKPMTLARWPDNLPSSSGQTWSRALDGTGEAGLIVEPACPAVAHKWADAPDAWIHSYLHFNWWDAYVGIGSVTSTPNGTRLGFGKGWPGVDRLNEPSLLPLPGARWYVLNILSELDSSREYYIDRSNSSTSRGLLYFWPPGDIDGGASVAAGAFVSAQDNAIHIRGTSHVTLSTLVVSHSRLTGINATAVSNVWIRDCVVSNTGGNGIDLAGRDSGLVNSTVSDLGCAGVRAGGGNWTDLTPGNILVHGNTISNFSRWKRTYMPGLTWGGVGNNFTSNSISDGPHNGIFGGGNAAAWAGVLGANDCLFEGNTISHVAYEAEDSGGFYTCGQAGWALVNRGNILRNNTFRRVAKDLTSLTTGGVFAIYFDDLMSGWTVEGNTIEDSESGILLGGGRDTKIIRNSFLRVAVNLPKPMYDHHQPIYMDNRGMGGEKNVCTACNSSSCPPNSNYLRLVEALKNPAWAKYNISLANPCEPAGNVLECNRYCKSGNGLYGVGGTTCPSCALKIWGSTAANNYETGDC
jgi:hypothetical protein